MLQSILAIVAALVPTLLKNAGPIGAEASTLIANLLGPVETLIAGLKSGQSKTSDALAVLAALAATVKVLKEKTHLPQDVLAEINNVDQDVQKALADYALAQGGYDASLYGPITPVS